MSHRILHDMYQAPFRQPAPSNGSTVYCNRYGGEISIITGSAAFAITLARPTKAGILCKLVMETDGGGDATVTLTGGYNQAGTLTIVFNDAGDWVALTSVKVGTAYYWRVLKYEGVAITIAEETVTALTATTATVTTGDVTNLFADTITQAQGAPHDLVDTAVTLTIAHLLTKIIVATPTANRAQVLPTGTLMSATKAIAIGEAFDWSLVNLAAATYTETLQAGTDHTVVGNMVVAANSAGCFRSRKTATTTWITYRIG